MKLSSKIFTFVFSIFFSSNIFAQTKIPDTATFWSDYPAEDLANFLVNKMTDEELLAQIFMFGWAGKEPSGLLNQWVSNRGLGSVKVFGWNTDDTMQVARSISSLQKKAQQRHLQIPLFVATDQEGGWIRHVKGETTVTPGNMAIGASQLPMDAYYSAYYISKEIKALGINLNFAPTIDLYTDHQSTVIGSRSFGESPESVSLLSEYFVAGSIAAGVIPTAKHFPGHGDTSRDSHISVPVINIDLETLENRELIPFKALIAQNVPAIMSGHLCFPQILPNGEPASLSKFLLTDLLRKKLGYKGLIITDDTMMNGATTFAGSLSNTFKLAIEAGNDIILSSSTAALNEPLWTVNLNLMSTDAEFRKTVQTAARRVILYKLYYFKNKNPTPAPLYPDTSKLSELIPDKDGQKFFLSQACRSITAYKKGDFPYQTNTADRILLAGPKQYPEFFDEGTKKYGADCGTYRFNANEFVDSADWVGQELASRAKNYDTIIICVSDKSAAIIARHLKNSGKKVIVLSALSPVHVLDFNWADTILFGYSYSPFSFKALFAALSGDFTPEGTVPLDLKK
ncbi:glycoside hydrolase family 3 protein [Treponema zioleckii]|uniref:glycoside hydrolase family 3 protein n=1 Tax=Treponema zioleckii TaxID=331680 RepID=UPI00168B3A21